MTNTNFKPIPDGRYTIVYPNNEYRTIQLETPKEGGLAGKQILALPSGDGKFKGIAFVGPRGIAFWKKFAAAETPQRLERIRRAYEVVAADPGAAGKAYGLKSGNCYRCFRQLTTPASLAAGIGPECAGKLNGWSKAEQVAGAKALRPAAAPPALPEDDDDADYRRQRSRDEQEYQLGLAQGRQYSNDVRMFGRELAEQWEMDAELARYNRGEDY